MENKNKLFYEFERLCINNLTPRYKKKNWLKLLDFFQDNWETFIEKDAGSSLLFNAAIAHFKLKKGLKV